MKSRKKRWERQVARMGLCTVFVENPEGKRLLWRPRRRWKDNTKLEFKEVGWESVGWIDLALDMDMWRAFVNAEMNM